MFIYDLVQNTCLVLMDEFVLEDPFLGLALNISWDITSPARERFRNTLSLLQAQSRFFKRVLATKLSIRPAFDIHSPPVVVSSGGHIFVSNSMIKDLSPR